MLQTQETPESSKYTYNGEFVITTKNPRDKFYRAYESVDRQKYRIIGVLVTGDSRLGAIDVTEKQNLEDFVESVGHSLFFKPAGGIIYSLPIAKAAELETSYSGMTKIDVERTRMLLDSIGMKLTAGIISSMSFHQDKNPQTKTYKKPSFLRKSTIGGFNGNARILC